MSKETVALGEFCDNGSVVVFIAGVGCPAGEYHVGCHPDMDFCERRGLLDLEGTVDEMGDWQWGGAGNPTDDQGNTIYKIQGFSDAVRYRLLVEEYENT